MCVCQLLWAVHRDVIQEVIFAVSYCELYTETLYRVLCVLLVTVSCTQRRDTGCYVCCQLLWAVHRDVIKGVMCAVRYCELNTETWYRLLCVQSVTVRCTQRRDTECYVRCQLLWVVHRYLILGVMCAVSYCVLYTETWYRVLCVLSVTVSCKQRRDTRCYVCWQLLWAVHRDVIQRVMYAVSYCEMYREPWYRVLCVLSVTVSCTLRRDTGCYVCCQLLWVVHRDVIQGVMYAVSYFELYTETWYRVFCVLSVTVSCTQRRDTRCYVCCQLLWVVQRDVIEGVMCAVSYCELYTETWYRVLCVLSVTVSCTQRRDTWCYVCCQLLWAVRRDVI